MSVAIDLWPIREAIASQLASNIDGTTCRPGRLEVARPCICLEPGDPYIGYFESYGDNGRASIQLNVKVYVATADDDSTDIAMDGYMSPGTGRSVIDALMADQTFGGVVETSICLNASVEADADGLIGTFPLQIVTTKTGVGT